MKSLKRVPVSYLLAFFLSLIGWSIGEAGVVLFKVGDTANIAGKIYTLTIIEGLAAIWKDSEGRYFQIETALRKDDERQILTEVILSKDNAISKRKASYEFGQKFPDPEAKLHQVALISKIVDGKILDRIIFTANPFETKLIPGLIFYYKDDSATFAGKEVTLDHFRKEVAVWKGNNNKKYYVLEISKQIESSGYVLREFR